jgi:hypothetical protein
MRIKGWLGRAEQAARIDGVGAPPNDGVLIADERKAG